MAYPTPEEAAANDALTAAAWAEYGMNWMPTNQQERERWNLECYELQKKGAEEAERPWLELTISTARDMNHFSSEASDCLLPVPNESGSPAPDGVFPLTSRRLVRKLPLREVKAWLAHYGLDSGGVNEEGLRQALWLALQKQEDTGADVKYRENRKK